MPDNPSLMSHVSLGTNDFDRAVAFYEAVLAPLGGRKLMDHPGASAFGKVYPEFWIQRPHDGKSASVGNGTHVGFMANSKAEVDAFWAAAREAGATPDGAPGPRKEYGAPYYGCFVRDPDGNKIEASFWDMSQA